MYFNNLYDFNIKKQNNNILFLNDLEKTKNEYDGIKLKGLNSYKFLGYLLNNYYIDNIKDLFFLMFLTNLFNYERYGCFLMNESYGLYKHFIYFEDIYNKNHLSLFYIKDSYMLKDRFENLNDFEIEDKLNNDVFYYIKNLYDLIKNTTLKFDKIYNQNNFFNCIYDFKKMNFEEYVSFNNKDIKMIYYNYNLENLKYFENLNLN